MAAELSIVIDTTNGTLLIDGPDRLPRELQDTIEGLAGPAQLIACAAPTEVRTLTPASDDELTGSIWVRIAGFWHGSLIEGPGRRSVAKLQGCPVRCLGCIAPETWDSSGGFVVPVERLADALLDPAYERDGVSILGGEPFSQPEALSSLVRELRSRSCRHILCYSGYTYETLLLRSKAEPAVAVVLDEIDMLIDGPYVAARADGAGPWTGSANQRVLALKASPRAHSSAGGAS